MHVPGAQCINNASFNPIRPLLSTSTASNVQLRYFEPGLASAGGSSGSAKASGTPGFLPCIWSWTSTFSTDSWLPVTVTFVKLVSQTAAMALLAVALTYLAAQAMTALLSCAAHAGRFARHRNKCCNGLGPAPLRNDILTLDKLSKASLNFHLVRRLQPHPFAIGEHSSDFGRLLASRCRQRRAEANSPKNGGTATSSTTLNGRKYRVQAEQSDLVPAHRPRAPNGPAAKRAPPSEHMTGFILRPNDNSAAVSGTCERALSTNALAALLHEHARVAARSLNVFRPADLVSVAAASQWRTHCTLAASPGAPQRVGRRRVVIVAVADVPAVARTRLASDAMPICKVATADFTAAHAQLDSLAADEAPLPVATKPVLLAIQAAPSPPAIETTLLAVDEAAIDIATASATVEQPSAAMEASERASEESILEPPDKRPSKRKGRGGRKHRKKTVSDPQAMDMTITIKAGPITAAASEGASEGAMEGTQLGEGDHALVAAGLGQAGQEYGEPNDTEQKQPLASAKRRRQRVRGSRSGKQHPSSVAKGRNGVAHDIGAHASK